MAKRLRILKTRTYSTFWSFFNILFSKEKLNRSFLNNLRKNLKRSGNNDKLMGKRNRRSFIVRKKTLKQP